MYWVVIFLIYRLCICCVYYNVSICLFTVPRKKYWTLETLVWLSPWRKWLICNVSFYFIAYFLFLMHHGPWVWKKKLHHHPCHHPHRCCILQLSNINQCQYKLAFFTNGYICKLFSDKVKSNFYKLMPK